SVQDLVAGVDVATATARPVAGAHTICELVLHMTTWAREATRRLRDGVSRDPETADWPAAEGVNDERWAAIQAAFHAANAELVARGAALEDRALDEPLGDARDGARTVTRGDLLHGIVQHHVYHAGQIALLKR